MLDFVVFPTIGPQTVLALRGSNGVGLVPRISHIWSRGGCRGAAAENAPSEPLDLAWPPGWPWPRGTEAEMGQGSILVKN